jgi:hypothetical protein
MASRAPSRQALAPLHMGDALLQAVVVGGQIRAPVAGHLVFGGLPPGHCLQPKRLCNLEWARGMGAPLSNLTVESHSFYGCSPAGTQGRRSALDCSRQ